MQSLLEQFTFEVKNISSYELGKSQYGKLPEMSSVEGGPEEETETEQRKDLSSTVLSLSEEIEKVAHFIS